MNNYDDIINLPHHVSSKHPHMPVEDRAAQFAPFAALTGHKEAVIETARLTDYRVELDEGELANINENLLEILEKIDTKPEVSITFFIPDEKKYGGAYLTEKLRLIKFDEYNRNLIFEKDKKIALDSIVKLELFQDLID